MVGSERQQGTAKRGTWSFRSCQFQHWCCQSAGPARALGRSGAAACQNRHVRTGELTLKGHMGTFTLTTRALRGCNQSKVPFVEPYQLLLVGINLSGDPFSSFGESSRMPREKKIASRYPLFFRNLFLMLLYLHASASDGVGVRTRTPLRYSLCPQIRAMRASSRLHG
jgi:hypothetical protein